MDKSTLRPAEMTMYILAPVDGASHYFMVTEVGVFRGLIVKWTHDGDVWKPSVRRVDEFEVSGELSEEKYIQIHPDQVDPEVLQAMMGVQS